MYLNAFYALQKPTYSDALIQTIHHKTEFSAFCEMVNRHQLTDYSQAFQSVERNQEEIRLSHTNRRSEFKNHLIEEMLETFYIEHFLSHKSYPYDNAPL